MVTNVTKESAFDAIYESYSDRVYKTALHYSNNHHTAEEITQTVFMKLYINMDNINMSAVGKWLSTSAKHMAMNDKRDRKRELLIDEFTDEEELGSGDLEDEFLRNQWEKEHSELASSIFADLYSLNPKWYDAITITYFLEKPQKEVAEVMGMDIDSLHSMLYRARKWIRKNYEARYNNLKEK